MYVAIYYMYINRYMWFNYHYNSHRDMPKCTCTLIVVDSVSMITLSTVHVHTCISID